MEKLLVPRMVVDKRPLSEKVMGVEEVQYPYYRILYRDLHIETINISYRIEGGKNLMSLRADVICIGQFSKDIISYLDYDKEAYETMQDGLACISTFFNCNTADQSRRLAEALGADYSDFSTHHVNKDKVNWDALTEMCVEELEAGGESVQWFRYLLEEKNFVCIYQPNR